jgi:hypothetical protein
MGLTGQETTARSHPSRRLRPPLAWKGAVPPTRATAASGPLLHAQVRVFEDA